MHHLTFGRYRRLLFLTVLEAARNVARTTERPDGVSERAWNRWEAGEAPIPQQVADNLTKLVAQRQALLDSLAAMGGSYTPTTQKDNIVAYKIAQSVAAQAAAMGINIGDAQDG
ncbi:DUF1870 family protein [Conchiformibius steedae]|uniref:Aca2/YdiL-like domain-containing protein n=1 Tax=Conchiformibius steedae TaxID=153493 RepID=UPI0026F256D2|nr:DUF1870 family protein [Conchiformibius steedae]